LAVGAWDVALELVEADLTLPARAVAALAQAGKGDVDGALSALRDALDDAADTEPGFRGALLDLAALQVRAGKHRAALRSLDELAGLDPSFRPGDVAAARAQAKAGLGA
jgi:tetratricopeptide (TPR) repeat protein